MLESLLNSSRLRFKKLGASIWGDGSIAAVETVLSRLQRNSRHNQNPSMEDPIR